MTRRRLVPHAFPVHEVLAAYGYRGNLFYDLAKSSMRAHARARQLLDLYSVVWD